MKRKIKKHSQRECPYLHMNIIEKAKSFKDNEEKRALLTQNEVKKVVKSLIPKLEEVNGKCGVTIEIEKDANTIHKYLCGTVARVLIKRKNSNDTELGKVNVSKLNVGDPIFIEFNDGTYHGSNTFHTESIDEFCDKFGEYLSNYL